MKSTNHKCIICGRNYYSSREKSRFCSNVCKSEYFRKTPYPCDYCGKEILLYPYEINQLKENIQKHQYCSRECANKGKIKAKNDKKMSKKICKLCGNIFYTYHHEQQFCDKVCRGRYDSKQIICVCDNCGVYFTRKQSEVINKKFHFCSNNCKNTYQSFSKEDIDLIIKYYHKIKTSELITMLSKQYNEKSINAKAIKLGLSQRREWTQPEIQILIEHYRNTPIFDITKFLPNRTEISIRRKAQELGLKSNFYLNRVYTEEENQYLIDNYLTKTNEELARHLGRGEYAIAQRLWFLKLYRPNMITKTGYRYLNNFMRARLTMWRDKYREENNYICSVTGERSNIVVHHCRSFNSLMEETIQKLQFKIKENFEDYTDEELEMFVSAFLDLQEKYKEYVCVTEKVHTLFHNIYGYGDNTMEQWDEFVNNYKNGVYNDII